ncbi:MAG: radical SAM protein [bacterium]|nr:radical SAM protein [bacterium]
MGIVDRMITYTQRKALREIMNRLPNFSMNGLIRMTHLAELLTRNQDDKEILRHMRDAFRREHPTVLLARDVMGRLSPNCRDRLVNNLLLNDLVIGNSLRENEIYEREGFVPPLLLVISPTMRCNLRCYGCYAGEYDQHFGLPFELVDRIIGEAKELGIYFITFSGGEVFTRDDIWKIYEKHNDVYFQLYTNGTLIDREAARRLAELGNVAPMISVEGMEERTERRRGPGTYRRIMAAMDALAAEGVVFGASCTETRENIDEICSDEFVDMLVAKGAMVLWYFQYIPIGRAPALDLMPTPEQRDEFRRRVRAVRNGKPIFVGDFWNDGYFVGGCIAGGRHYLHINANGDVEPCVFCHFAVDNIREKSLRESLQSDFFRAIRARQPYTDNLLRPCMLVDCPEVLEEVVRAHGARPTHPGAESLITVLREPIREYAERYARLADRAWEKEYIEKGYARGYAGMCS